MPQKIWYVFDEQKPWFVPLQYPYDVLKQITPLGTFKSKLLASLRKGLTWEACTQNVVRRNVSVGRTDVIEGTKAKILFVKVGKFGIDLGCENTPMTELLQRLMKAAKPRE